MLRRALVRALAASALLPPAVAQAADFPGGPLRILVLFAAGGRVDVISRLLGRKLPAQLVHPVVIENKTGASKQVAMGAQISAPAASYTLTMTSLLGLSINQSLHGKALPRASRRSIR